MLNILSGYQTANIKSFPAGEALNEGEWVEFGNDGKVKKVTGVYTGAKGVFPVYAGNVKFYDTKSLNEVDVVTAKSGILECDNVEDVTIKAGDAVYVKDGKLTNAANASGGKVIGYAIEDANPNDIHSQFTVVKFALA